MKKSRKRAKPKIVQYWNKFWYFIWEDDSVWSWIANIILAFLLIRFIVYPGLGLAMGTTHPIVAVVSDSMEHKGAAFDDWFEQRAGYYNEVGIYKEDFREFNFKNGFNKGDLMFLTGKKAEDIEVGDIIVFKALRHSAGKVSNVDIIHRVIKKWEQDNEIYFQTKGDKNPYSIESYINRTTGSFLNPKYKSSPDAFALLDETIISEDRIIGTAGFRVPYLGWVKIWFVKIVNFLSNAVKTNF